MHWHREGTEHLMLFSLVHVVAIKSIQINIFASFDHVDIFSVCMCGSLTLYVCVCVCVCACLLA